MDQIPEVFKIDYIPELPDIWEIKTLEKYDDGFMSPSVTINYKNGVRLLLGSGNWILTNDFKNMKVIKIGSHDVDYYFNEQQFGYVVKVDQICYAIIAPVQLQEEIEKWIEEL